MPVPKAEYDEILPFDLHEPAEILEPDKLYTIPEIARLLQGLPVDAELSEFNESVFIDWAIPWMISNQDDLVVAEPKEEDVVGLFGLDA